MFASKALTIDPSLRLLLGPLDSLQLQRAKMAKTMNVMKTMKVMKYQRPHRCSVCEKTGHRLESCPKRKPPMKKRPNRIDKKTLYTTTPRQKRTYLKDLKQIGFPEIVKMTEIQAKKKLKELGLVPLPVMGRKCWNCGKKMVKRACHGKHAISCPSKCCRKEIRRAHLAYTPLWSMQKGGHLSYQNFLRALYVYGAKVPQDGARHLLGCGYDSVETWFHMFRTATGYAELYSGRELVFPDGTVEYDGTKTNIDRTKRNTNTHCGRFLVICHRETGQYVLEPLANKDVKKGAPPPPESYAEVRAPIVKKVHAGHVASSDSARSFKKVVKTDLEAKGVKFATVVHSKKQFVKVVRLPIKYLSARIRDRVAQLPTTTARTYRFKAGDNLAEATFGAVKRNLSRMNLQRSTKRASINFLASAWLNKNVGLEGVARGLVVYQNGIKDTINPKKAFKDLSWLKGLEPM
jgi:hypothetical protein